METYAGKPFALLGINSDRKIERAKKAIQDNKLNWRSWWQGAAGTGGKISTTWNVSGWPTIVLIDHKGVIRYRAHSIDDKLIKKLVQEAEGL